MTGDPSATAASAPWLERYPPGIPRRLEPPYRSMLEAWRATRSRLGDDPLLFHFDHPISAAQLDRWSDAFADWLRGHGVERGARIAVCLQNDPHWATAVLAAWKLGLVVVPLNPMVRERELTHHLADSGSTVLVCDAALHGDVAAAVTSALAVTTVVADPRGCCGGSGAGPRGSAEGAARLEDVLADRDGARTEELELDGADLALLTYTSGTTGPPKGAMNSHANLVYSASVAARWYGLDEHERILGIAPLFHITGLVAQLAVCLSAGTPLVLFHRFDAGVALELAERWRTTFSVGAITAYIAMMADPGLTSRDLSSMTKVASGGAPVSTATVARFEELTGAYIHNAFGMTETTAPCILVPLGVRAPVDATSGALSVGVPVPGAEIEIVDPETRQALPAGGVGEIVISGPMVVSGYWNKPDESRHAMPGGRLHSGDIGRMDDQGWIYIVDRAKDQINASGYKIWPREVEDVLYEHPAVREAAVVGRPDPYRGETVAAVVSLRPGASATPNELIQFCRERLAAYKVPRLVELQEDLPKTLTGKILRRVLRDPAHETKGEQSDAV